MGEYAKQLLIKNHNECSLMNVEVGARTESGYTITSDFNHELYLKGIPKAAIYAPLGIINGDRAVHIEPRQCELVDCMHPCYGVD